MADYIVQLSDQVANQIAAGEVVGRPASVVKELVENSVDAGGTEIVVLVKDAGRTLIQVIDNGKGMSEEDARKCFLRHATSKITSADDLLTLVTKGFRGEALASISAIAHVELKTRESGAEMGVKICISGDEFTESEPISCSEGSSFSVKNLFFNVPARRNFLKSDQVELRHIVDEFQRVAMAHPQLSFRLQSNGNDLFNLKPGTLRQRVVAIFGVKHDERLVPIEEETDVVKISGFVGKPSFSRRTRGEQFLFVNGRYIKHPLMHRAIMKAYDGVLTPGNFPLYTIFLEVDPSKVDVNIHPTKMEAKFEEDQIIFAFLRSAIKRGLGKHNVAPSLDFESEMSISIENLPKGKVVPEPSVRVNPEYNPFLSTQSEQKNSSLDSGSPFGDFSNPIPKDIDELYSKTPNKISEPEQESSLRSIVGGRKLEIQLDSIFQLDNRYIVSAKDEELVIIDIKRAHERILYEDYLNSGRGGGSEVSQRLLFPEPILISKADIDLLLGAADVLKLFGLDIAKSESGGLEVLAVPSGLAEKLQDCIDSVLEALQDGTWTDVEGRRERFARVWAEAGSVNKKVRLSKEEMVDIVERLFECESPGIDARGRSVFTNLTVDNIETKLK
jgi:DNA mismatch repair protein MutL